MVNHNEILHIPRMAIIKRQIIPSISENMEKLEHSYLLRGM